MKNFLIALSLVLVTLASQTAYAAFPINATAKATATNITTEPAISLRGSGVVKTDIESTSGPSHRTDYGWSIASFVCAIVGVPLLSIVFGALALSLHNSLQGLAIAGIAIGALEVIIVVLLLTTFAM